MDWPVGQYYPFWREDSVYPLLHYVWPLSLYAATRSMLFTMFFVYVWETLEQILARAGYATFAAEQWDDSWIGDIAIGVLAAGTFGLADIVWTWQDAILYHGPPLWLRIIAFFGQVACIFGIARRQLAKDARIESLVFAIAYGIVTLAVYAPYWHHSGPGFAIRTSTLVWLGTVFAAALVNVPQCPNPRQPDMPTYVSPMGRPGCGSAWTRSFIFGLLLLVVVLSAYIHRFT